MQWCEFKYRDVYMCNGELTRKKKYLCGDVILVVSWQRKDSLLFFSEVGT